MWDLEKRETKEAKSKPLESKYCRKTHPCQRLKPQIMPLDCFDPVCSGKPPIPIHYKSDMLWNWPLPDCSNQQVSEFGDRKLDGG